MKPAVDAVNIDPNDMHDAIEEVAHLNVELSITRIKQESTILAEMEKAGEIEIVGAIYNVSTGFVGFI